jgi:cytochrome c553
MDRTLQAIDLSRLTDNGEWSFATLATLPTQATEKLAAQVLLGKQLFNDARDTRLARDGYLSCASCHADGGHDGRTWDLTAQGEGLRNTINLRGRGGVGQGRLHWSGNFDEVQDFEGQIRALAGGTGLMSDALFGTGTRSQPLGLAKAGQSPELDALAAYLASLNTMPKSVDRTSAGGLSPDAVAGRAVFAAQGCGSCHGGTTFANSGTLLVDIGTLKSSSGKRLGKNLTGIDVPTLRDLQGTAPYLHDGSAATLGEAVLAHRGVALSSADLSSLVAYLRQIGSEEVAAPVSLPSGAVPCAPERGSCALPKDAPATVYYGANGRWFSRSAVSGAVACNNAAFGDPLLGTPKACYYVPAVKCSEERSDCTVPAGESANILYGVNGSYHQRSGVSGTFLCGNALFGDPVPGPAKACWRRQ